MNAYYEDIRPTSHVRAIENYQDLPYSKTYSPQLVSFYDYLSDPLSDWFLDALTLPEYVDLLNFEQLALTDAMRKCVIEWLCDELSSEILGLEDVSRWDRLFRNRLIAVTPTFWAACNLQGSLSYQGLLRDLDTVTNTGTSRGNNGGGSTTTSDSTAYGDSDTDGTSNGTNHQDGSNSTRTAGSTLPLSSNVQTGLHTDWNHTDNLQETLTDNADTTNSSTSHQENEHRDASHAVSATVNNGTSESINEGITLSDRENKQFSYELPNLYNFILTQFPLVWLKAQISDLFYKLY
jgi:hypothetical protein